MAHGFVLDFAGSDHLRDVFGKAMGLSDQDIVALSGGHTIVCNYFQCRSYFERSISHIEYSNWYNYRSFKRLLHSDCSGVYDVESCG